MLLLQLSSLCLPMDARVKEKVRQLTVSGVRRLAEVRRHVHSYVVDDLFAGRAAPLLTDARYWPSSQTLLNTMRRSSTATQSAISTYCLFSDTRYC